MRAIDMKAVGTLEVRVTSAGPPGVKVNGLGFVCERGANCWLISVAAM